jgi:uncharacterized membrane protein
MDRTRHAEASLVDPISSRPGFDEVQSRIAVGGHPIHAMLVSFPIALTVCTLGADAFYWWTGDLFWARAALWSVGMAFIAGVLAGISGTFELLLVPGIRARASSWTHFVVAMTLLSLLGVNWGFRLQGYEQALLPFGMSLTAVATVFAAAAGWHGGKLVFTYQVGTSSTGS